ncbi:MAG: tetratricopeptide repeat protein [Planctomycetota bacterium]
MNLFSCKFFIGLTFFLWIGCATVPIQESSQLAQQGIEKLQVHHYEEALALFQSSQQKTDRAEIHFWLALTYYYLNQPSTAQQFFQSCLDKKPSSEIDTACQKKLKLLKEFPSLAYDADLKKGFSNEDIPSALSEKTKERLAEESFLLGVEKEEETHWNQAEEYYNQSITLGRLPQAYIHKGRLLLDHFPQRSEEGVQQLQTAIELLSHALKEEESPKEISRLWANVGMVYRILIEHEHPKQELAEKAYQKSIEYDAKNYESYYYLGCIYQDQQKFNESILQFRKAIESAPQLEASYYQNDLAWLLTTEPSVKNTKESIPLAQQAIAINPIHPNWDTLAQAYYEEGQLEKAILTLEKALSLCSQEEDLLYYHEKLKTWNFEKSSRSGPQ